MFLKIINDASGSAQGSGACTGPKWPSRELRGGCNSIPVVEILPSAPACWDMPRIGPHPAVSVPPIDD